MLEVSVYENAKLFAQGTRCLCRRIDYGSVTIPYDSIFDTFRCLYGSGVVVTFTIML